MYVTVFSGLALPWLVKLALRYGWRRLTARKGRHRLPDATYARANLRRPANRRSDRLSCVDHRAYDSPVSAIFASQLTAVTTVVLAMGAIVTAIFAIVAFRGQAEMLRVQSERLDVYREQVDELRPLNEQRLETLGLQTREIRTSLDQRKRSDEEERRSQAAKVTAWLERPVHDGPWEIRIRNDSDLCIFDVRVFFHEIRKHSVEGWEPILIGEPPPRDETICVFPPKHSRSVAVPDKIQALFPEFSDRTCVVSIEFTDAAENKWERDPRGALMART